MARSTGRFDVRALALLAGAATGSVALGQAEKGIDPGAVGGGTGAAPVTLTPILDEDYSAPLMACFSEDDPPTQAYMAEVMRWVYEHNGWTEGERYHLAGRWSGSQGDPRALTWSFVPDGLSADGAPSTLFATLDSQYASQGGRATWVARVQSVFDRWQELTGVTYTRIKSGANDWDDGASWGSSGSSSRGDVRIAATFIDGSGGVLAYNYYPGSGTGGNMMLDSGDNWGATTNQNRFFRNTVAHEHGHGIGLQHTCSSNSHILMEPFLSTAFDGPQHDDIRGGQRHYGDPFEPDNTAGTATHVGTLSVGTPLALGDVPGTAISDGSILCIDANGEQDWFRFTVSSGLTATFTLDPIGRIYNDDSQAASGSCNSGTSTDSNTRANLAMDVLASDGVTVLASASSAASGANEVISDLALLPGDYYIRVYETDAPTQSQLYRVDVTAEAVPNKLLVVFTGNVTLPGLGTVRNEDVVQYDPGTGLWTMVFDGSDLGLGAATIDGLTILEDGEGGSDLLISFAQPGITVAGLTGGPDGEVVDDSDIIRFSPTTYGLSTAGSFSFYFDGSDVGLTDDPEDIDAIAIYSGSLAVSALGNPTVTGLSAVRDEDIILFLATTLGADTAGTWAWLFDGSDVGLADAAGEDVDAAGVDAGGVFYLSTFADSSVPGIALLADEDVAQFTPTSIGATTAGTYALFQDLSALGVATTADVNALEVTALDLVGGGLKAPRTPGSADPVCPGDWNSDGVVNSLDLADFLNAFSAGDADADFNTDGHVDTRDFAAFLNAFNAGC